MALVIIVKNNKRFGYETKNNRKAKIKLEIKSHFIFKFLILESIENFTVMIETTFQGLFCLVLNTVRKFNFWIEKFEYFVKK